MYRGPELLICGTLGLILREYVPSIGCKIVALLGIKEGAQNLKEARSHSISVEQEVRIANLKYLIPIRLQLLGDDIVRS